MLKTVLSQVGHVAQLPYQCIFQNHPKLSDAWSQLDWMFAKEPSRTGLGAKMFRNVSKTVKNDQHRNSLLFPDFTK